MKSLAHSLPIISLNEMVDYMPAEKFWLGGAKAKQRNRETALKEKEKDKKPKKITLDGEKVRDGLAQLVLTVVELLRELMEKQAIRRIEAGSITDEQTERLGATFMNLKKEIEKLKKYFNVKDEDLNLDLGPIGHLRDSGGGSMAEKASVVDILDRILGKGVIIKGDVIISVADVDLVSLNLGVLLASIDKARELTGRDLRAERLEDEVKRLQEELRRIRK